MLDSITLTNIILAELIAALTVVMGMLIFVLYRERRAHKRLLADYQRLRNTVRVGTSGSNELTHWTDDGRPIDPVAEHLRRAQEEAQKRYQAITETRMPRLAADLPFNAKIAALRHVYLRAEIEAYQQHLAARDTWVKLEQRLRDIARWIVEQKERGKDKHTANRIRLLQKRVEALRPYEQKTQQLQHKLELAKSKQAQLQEYQDENLVTIKKLRQINEALSLSLDQQPLSPAQLNPRFADSEPGFAGSQQNSRNASLLAEHRYHLDNIGELSAQYELLNHDLTSGVRGLRPEDGRDQGRLESVVQQLETELDKSQRYIDELKQQLNVRVVPATPSRLKTVEGEYTQAPYAPVAQSAMGRIEETLHVVRVNQDDNRNKSAHKAKGKKAAPLRPYALQEIEHLRTNNRHQRNLIVGLEKELRSLRESISETAPSPERDSKIEEMLRLEQLVRECEHCITALESEVDLLYSRLQERENAPDEEGQEGDGEATGELTNEDGLQHLSAELEAVSSKLQQTLMQNRRDTFINQFALTILRAHSLEDLATCLIDTIKSAGLTVGFFIRSSLGRAEFYRGNQFTDHERRLTQKTTIAAPVAYLNEGIFFASNYMHLLLKDPPVEDEDLAHAEALLTALLNLSSARIHYLEVTTQSVNHNRDLDEWSQQTHDNLMGLEIRYAYQAEEILRQLTNLDEELQQLTANLELGPSARKALGNALSECRHRIDRIFNNEESMDQHCSRLLEHLDALPRSTS